MSLKMCTIQMFLMIIRQLSRCREKSDWFCCRQRSGREYYTFSYDEKQGFTCTMHEEINGNNMRITRGIYIEDMLYVIQGNIIEAYSLKDFKKVDDIIL